jgi:uncharacterized protein (TIGR03435 family)
MIRKLALILTIASALGLAQPAFEVASIKPNHSGDRFPSLGPTTGGKFTVSNATVMWLLHTAYKLDDFRIVGLPPWTNTERFDITAKAADGNATADQLRQMIQALLADRFQMTVHRENREQQLFALTVAKSGPKLQKVKSDTCPDTGTQANPCGGFRIFKRSQMWGNTVTVAQFAAELTYFMERMVVDKTGIPGVFDIRVEWTPEHFGPEPGETVKPDEANPTLFTAVQEQLGLKLQAEKGPVEVLVIDKVSRPVEN